MLTVTPSSTSSRSAQSSLSNRHAMTPSSREKLVVKPSPVARRESSTPRTPFPPQAPEYPADTLKAIIGNKGRRSRCAPEFLCEVATAKRVQFDLLEKLGRKFKIITGKEAVGFYRRFLKGKDVKGSGMSIPVVFAVTVTDAGRKLVDYYLTWRGQTRARELRGSQRKVALLDSEFRKVARTLDKEFKLATVYGSVASIAGSTNSEIRGPSETAKPKPLSIVIPEGKKTELPDVPPPRSATDSVTSLPVLTYVRGVPFGNRMLLTVTNPDRLSTISSDSVQDVLAAPRNTLASVAEEPATEPSSAPTPIVKVSPPNRTETPSSRSTSPQSEASTSPANVPSAKDASSQNVHTTRKEKVESKSGDEPSSEFLIVLLDEEIDKNGSTWHGLERQTSRSSARSLPSRISPWDGPLARANGITYRTPPVRRVSSTKARARPADDDSSSSSEEWENEPVIPLKPYIVPSLTSEPPPSRVASPASMQYTPGAMPTLSVPYASPMMSVHSLNMGYPSAPAYGSPYMQAQANHLPPVVSSPYSSPYMSPNMSLHRSLSQASYMGYGSPYVS